MSAFEIGILTCMVVLVVLVAIGVLCIAYSLWSEHELGNLQRANAVLRAEADDDRRALFRLNDVFGSFYHRFEVGSADCDAPFGARGTLDRIERLAPKLEAALAKSEPDMRWASERCRVRIHAFKKAAILVNQAPSIDAAFGTLQEEIRDEERALGRSEPSGDTAPTICPRCKKQLRTAMDSLRTPNRCDCSF